MSEWEKSTHADAFNCYSMTNWYMHYFIIFFSVGLVYHCNCKWHFEINRVDCEWITKIKYISFSLCKMKCVFLNQCWPAKQSMVFDHNRNEVPIEAFETIDYSYMLNSEWITRETTTYIHLLCWLISIGNF